MKIAMYDLEGHLLEVLEGNTYKDIINLLPKNSKIKHPASIQRVIKGERNFAGIYQFREIINDRPLEKIGNCTQLKKTNEYSIHKYYKGRYISTYINIQDAVNKNRIPYANIIFCLQEKRKSAGGFEWKYAS